jgi:hypothetical protein
MDVEGLHRLIAEEGPGLGWCIERRASRAASAYEAMATQLRAVHAAACLSVISVDDICDYSDEYLAESAQEIRAQLDILMTDVDALAKSLRRLAHVSGDAGDEA